MTRYLYKYNMKLQEAMQKWQASGRLAFYYPRKHTVSLNGGRQMSETKALIYLTKWFNDLRPCYCDYVFHAQGC